MPFFLGKSYGLLKEINIDWLIDDDDDDDDDHDDNNNAKSSEFDQNARNNFHNEKNTKIGALSSISKVVTLLNLFSGERIYASQIQFVIFVSPHEASFLWIMELAHFASVLSRLASGQFQIKANAKNISFYEHLEFSSA